MQAPDLSFMELLSDCEDSVFAQSDMKSIQKPELTISVTATDRATNFSQ